MLSNAYYLAKFRFDTAENEPTKNLPIFSNFANFSRSIGKNWHRGGSRRPMRAAAYPPLRLEDDKEGEERSHLLEVDLRGCTSCPLGFYLSFLQCLATCLQGCITYGRSACWIATK